MSTWWELRIDRARCTRSGLCVGTSPAHFAFDEGGQVVAADVVRADDAVLDAARCCPMEAITVTEVASGRQLAPEDDPASTMATPRGDISEGA